VESVAVTVLDGRSVGILGGAGGTLRIWDLRSHQQIGTPLTGHTNDVTAVATTVLDGRPVAVSASRDNTLRIWDLAQRVRN
jgi:WD40 repeat protein